MIYTLKQSKKADKLENNPVYYSQEGENPVNKHC